MVNFRLCGFQLTKQNKNKKTEKKKKKNPVPKKVCPCTNFLNLV